MNLIARLSLPVAAAGCLLLTACESGSDYLSDATEAAEDASIETPDISSWSSNDLSANLTDYANEYLSSLGVELPDSIRDALDDLIRGGVDTLMESDLVQANLMDAQNNLKKFLDRLVGDSGITADGILDATPQSFEKVKQSICPLEPFC